MDLVIPYVTSGDKRWRDSCNKYAILEGKEPDADKNRFREMISPKYILRAIEKNMPFIKTVFFVVQTRRQVPEYIKESEHLKIVTHREFIPKEYLPLFNSSAIEMFIHKIPGLDTRYIYSNDDIVPIKRLKANDFFKRNIPRIHAEYKVQIPTGYTVALKNTENLIRGYLRLEPNFTQEYVLREGHSMNAFNRKTAEKIYKDLDSAIRKSISKFRTSYNYTQQVATYYQILSGKYAERDLNTKYFSFNAYTIEDMLDIIEHSDYQIVCINDSGCTNPEYSKRILNRWLKERFPYKSKYEK